MQPITKQDLPRILKDLAKQEGKKLEIKRSLKFMQEYQAWRRYDGPVEKSPPMPDPQVIGLVIDDVIQLLRFLDGK